MKILFRIGVIFFIFSVGVLQASLRKSVVIIECSPHKKYDETLSRISTSFYKNGYKDISDYLESIRKGWRGSGFIVRDRYGQYFLVSNKHVLENSDKITIFINDNNKKVEIFNKDARIIEDRYLDIAMIALPRNKIRYRPLSLYVRNVDDGQEIFSAGYPDLLGSPTWQLAKGVVTNFSTPVPSIVDPKICRLVQHSAAIDPGSSGGPLLRKIRGAWYVVGVSSFTIRGRRDTHFAIPASKVKGLMRLYQNRKRASRNKRLLKRELSSFVKEISSQFNGLKWNPVDEHRYASIRLTAETGWDSLLILFENDDAEFIDKMKRRFDSLSFFGALRECVSWSAWKNFRSQIEKDEGNFSFVNWKTIPAKRQEGSIATALVKYGSETGEMDFVYERGHWYIDSLPLESPKVENTMSLKSDDGSSYYSSSLFFGTSFVPGFLNSEYSGDDPVAGFGLFLGWENGVAKYFSYTHLFAGSYLKHEIPNDWDGELTTVKSFGMEYQLAARIRIPVSFGWGTFTPYVLGGLEMLIVFNDASMASFAVPIDAGGGLEFKFKGGHGIGFSSYRRFNPFGVDALIEDMKLNVYYMFSWF